MQLLKNADVGESSLTKSTDQPTSQNLRSLFSHVCSGIGGQSVAMSPDREREVEREFSSLHACLVVSGE